MTVVHSLRPEDIRSETEGAKLLRRYLEFIRDGEVSIEGAITASPAGEAESPFEDAVGRALEERGFRIQRQVGCAKYFIDIVVMSEDGTSCDLAIECDGAAYHSSPSARDRDRIRQERLEQLGWKGRIHRVWSTAWIRSPRAELEVIERAVHRARSNPREEHLSVGRSTAVPQAYPSADRQLELIAEPLHSVVSEASQFVFPKCVAADLRRFSRSTDLRTASVHRVADMVSEVVKAEGPVHPDLVVDRLREHSLLQRAGRLVREAVMAGVAEALQRGTVAWLPRPKSSHGPREEFLVSKADHLVEPRGLLPDGSVRVIEHICDREVEAGVLLVVAAMIGATREEVVTTTARAFGYARTGGHVEERLRKAIDRLLAAGGLKERMGSIVLPG